MMRKIVWGASCLVAVLSSWGLSAQTLEEAFLHPPQEARAMMIWQWMDGCVTREGITADLEAYKAAGLGGVQQFLIGGPSQTRIKRSENAIGTENWRSLMRFAMDECARLGLTFGTHNCPGWTSSSYTTVQPEYSMQNLVWSETPAMGTGKVQSLTLPRSEVDPKWDYYRDVTVVAVPASETISLDQVIVIPDTLTPDGGLQWTVPDGAWVLYRFGHTTNGKDNHGTAPEGGVGLECDKMSAEAVDHFWSQFPAEIIRIAGPHAGKTFLRFEVDSYECGGQSWTPRLPEEFMQHCGYDILPWLPVFAGRTIVSAAATEHFLEDYARTGQDLVAHNYYGRLSELAHQSGLVLLVEPYGQGGQPFNPVDTRKVCATIAPDDPIAAEFWTQPLAWGWPEVPSVVSAARAAGHETVLAEGFTCVPGYAWKDDPDGLKRVGDKAYCLGINGFMLHAGASNPWPDVRPGMTFGAWGTQWTPGQTWWKDGAPALFEYFARCQSLLRRGRFVDDFHSSSRSLATGQDALQWIHRQDGDIDFYFVANTADTPVQTVVSLTGAGRVPEFWNPENAGIADAPAWQVAGGRTGILLDLGAGQSTFIVLRRATDQEGPGLALPRRTVLREWPVAGPWRVSFPERWGAPAEITLPELASWSESPIDGVKYFSGTARYEKTLNIKKINTSSRYVLDLGDVKNLAVVRVNGQPLPVLWRPPFRIDVTDFLRKGDNNLEIDVTNLWVNRLVGDEREPDDLRWTEQRRPGSGAFILEEPDWLKNGTPRPSQGRKAVVSYKIFTKDEPLLPSGLLGPVVLREVSE